MALVNLLEKLPLGEIFVLISAIMFGSGVTVSKLIINELQISFETIVAFRYLAIAFLMVPFVLKDTEQLEMKIFDVFILLLSAIFLGLSTSLNYKAIESIPPVDSAALHHTSPVYTLIISAIFLKEKFKLYHLVLTILIVISVFVICQSTFFYSTSHYQTSKEQLAMLYGALSALTASLTLVAMRYLKGRSGYVISFGHGMFISLAILTVHPSSFAIPLSSRIIRYMVLTTALGCGGQFCLLLALKKTNAAMVASFRTTEVLFNIILQKLIIGTVPNCMSIIGCFVLFFCILLIPLHEQVMNLFNFKKERNSEENIKFSIHQPP